MASEVQAKSSCVKDLGCSLEHTDSVVPQGNSESRTPAWSVLPTRDIPDTDMQGRLRGGTPSPPPENPFAPEYSNIHKAERRTENCLLVAGSSSRNGDQPGGRPRTSQRTSMKKTLMKEAFEACCERCGGDPEGCGSIDLSTDSEDDEFITFQDELKLLKRGTPGAPPLAPAEKKLGKGRGGARRDTEVDEHDATPDHSLRDEAGREGGPAYQALLQVLEWSAPSLNVMDQPEFLDFNVVPDSGAAEHVANSDDAPGYDVRPGAGSRAGGCFIAANGEPIPNRGEMTLDLLGAEGSPISSTFQVAAISRPLWSVGRMCDAGYKVVFDSEGATVFHMATNEKVIVFPRKNGLYSTDMKLKNPKFNQSRPAITTLPRSSTSTVKSQAFRRQD